jgi:RING finger protein 113A
MFRKPKKSSKAGLRRKQQRTDDDDDDNDEEDKETRQELQHARKRAKQSKSAAANESDDDNDDDDNNNKKGVMQTFDASKDAPVSQKDLATSTNQHHPTKNIVYQNKMLAGPLKAPTNIRTTTRFDYQPDICKDYKDTGFCGFGDSCIYLHDRGDTLSGWQLEQQWEQEQAEKKRKQQEQVDAFMNPNNHNKTKNGAADSIIEDDGLPFACFICRNAFTDPIVTHCGHYYCQACILKHVQSTSALCPVCNKDTHSVFHQPTKLLSKKRKLLGRDATWQEFQEKCQNPSGESKEEE